MADFDSADKIIRSHEGGYANNPKDRGGETYRGIARKIWPGWSGWALIDGYKKHADFPNVLDTDPVLQKLVRAFYKENFWNALNLDQVNDQSMATELYDTSVNMGVGVAAIFLQRVLNATNRVAKDYPDIVVDGKVGANTIAILNKHPRPKEVFKLFNCLKGSRYMDIVEHNTSQEIFMTSWAGRIAS